MVPSATSLKAIEFALLQQPTVLDCAVRTRECDSGRPETVAYIVPSSTFQQEVLDANLQSMLPDLPLPNRYALLSGLPYSNDGALNEEMLARLEIPDEQLAKTLEQKLVSIPGIQQAAVLLEPRLPKAQMLHISDLIPETETRGPEGETPIGPVASNTAEDSTKRLAVSCGEPLRNPELIPTTLQRALKRAAQAKIVRDLTYVEADASEINQTYQELLEDAEHILGGLRKLGLQPGTKVLFQFDRNQDFISSFWGCILGGFIPAPIITAPTYKESNATIQKLHNAWELLERPTILTQQSLLNDLQNVSVLLHLQDFRVEAVEKLRASAADHDWHESQPDDPCLMLLTSGSTGTPKAVIQTHRSLMIRSAATAQMNQFDEADVFLNWFPLDHVGGIVMSHLMALFSGSRQINVPTEVILQDPLKWLDFIERYRATVTWAPNFAFGLINDREKLLELRSWDLASMRFILNGGEAIVPKTTRKFLHLLARFGLRVGAMHPAWGMSETCSGVTFSDRCSLHSIQDEQSFVEVGAPIPGVSIRIVDDQDQPREEGQIGHLQVAGPPVTAGYYRNPGLTRDCFSRDGWFNTGDLGLLRDGRLTITGRAKDVIIINGQNFYCHEVEALVEEVQGVNVSFSAACPVRIGETNTDQMAVFFNPVQNTLPEILQVIKSIRELLLRKMGIKPDFILPLSKKEIPKTAIGKIQRSKLRDQLEAGEFRKLLKQIDIESANANTLPDWFYRPVWQKREPSILLSELKTGTYLVFADESGLADEVCMRLSRDDVRCVRVGIGAGFERIGPDSYRINPTAIEDYRKLIRSVHDSDGCIRHVLHCWAYDDWSEEFADVDELRAVQYRGTYSLLFLMQALATVQGEQTSVRLFAITSQVQLVFGNEKMCPGKSTMSGLMSTCALEMPWLQCRLVDLSQKPPAANAEYVLRELEVPKSKTMVAYRDGQRLLPSLVKVRMLEEETHAIPIKPEGLYLITGGLGGLGTELAKYLIRRYKTKLILIGRTSMPEKPALNIVGRVPGKRLKNYLALKQCGGEFLYRPVDISDIGKLRACVEQAEMHWGQRLQGVFHLAGSGNLEQHWKLMDEHWITGEKVETFEWMFRPKVYGTWALFKMMEDRPGTLFVSFSSVNSMFGGATFSAYSAANSFLDCYTVAKHYQSQQQTYCFNWTMWDDLGMSESGPGYGRDMARSMGYSIISKEQGFNSMLAGLCRKQPQLVIGLDGFNPHLRQYLSADVYPLSQLAAYYESDGRVTPNAVIEPRSFAHPPSPAHCRYVAIPQMPLTERGEIDRAKLTGLAKKAEPASERAAEPRSEIEQKIAELWREELNLSQIRTEDSFFELGGDSLTAVRLVNRLREAFGVSLSVRTLFETPTIPQLALALGVRLRQEGDTSSRLAAQNGSYSARELLDRIDQIPDEQVDTLLQELARNEFD